MPKTTLAFLTIFIIVMSIGACKAIQGQDMDEITFDVGKNIVETARQSGAPEYQVGKAYSRISYSLNSIPEDLPFRFNRPGYEIVVTNPFSFTMYADEERYSNLETFTVSLLIDSDAVNSHEKSHAYVTDLLDQFQRGKWERYFDEDAARITGWSSYLDGDGKPSAMATGSLDPDYRFTLDEWISLGESTRSWEWVGEDVMAELSIAMDISDAMGTWYRISLDFQRKKHKLDNRRAVQARELREGDAAGFNSTERYNEAIAKLRARRAVLETKAIARGDSVVPRPDDDTDPTE